MVQLLLGLAALAATTGYARRAEQRSLADGPPPTPPQPPPPAGYRRAGGKDVITDRMLYEARSALRNPIGTLLPFDGWAIQIEWHFHEPEGPVRPWGWHKGATIYFRRQP